MTRVSTGMIEQTIEDLLRETAQAHFLHTLAPEEALVMLRERRDQLRRLLQNSSLEQPVSSLLLEHFRLQLTAEITWSERAIAILQSQEEHQRKQDGKRPTSAETTTS